MKGKISQNHFSRILFAAILVLTIHTTAFSQPGDPGGDPDVPITGIEWLLIGGGVFGAKKIYQNFKKKS